MTVAFAVLLAVHGLIHVLGVAKAFRLAVLPQVPPIGMAGGLVWLAASVSFLLAALALFLWPRWWWLVAAGAIACSTMAIAPSWSDARYGTVANIIAGIGVVFGFLSHGPFSLRAAYDRDVAHRLTAPASPAVLTKSDVRHLPAPVRRYLHLAGVVGQPRVLNYRVRLHGRIRSGPNSRWMPLRAEQYNFVGRPARLFYLNASMAGMPVQGYHRYADGSASMLIKFAALIPVAQASGDEMTQSETVTLFNDICLFAPAVLIDPSIEWEPVDSHVVRARFTNGAHTIGAELVFNELGELVNFVSDDRREISSDGTTMTAARWSTPMTGYRSFGQAHLAGGGEGRWHEAGGDYTYIEVTVDSIEYNIEGR